MTTTVLPGAEPLHHAGGDVGVLLCHGFTGSPQSLRPWATRLAAADLTVELPRLPGHGTTWQEMNHTTWRDWYDELDRAAGTLARRCRQVYAMGLSLGGCLALLLAGRRRDISGLVLVNPSLRADNPLLHVAPVLKYLIRSVPGIADDIAKPGVHELGYDRTPIAAAAGLPRLWAATRRVLPEINVPVLVFKSAVDHAVGPRSVEVLRHGLRPDLLTVRTCKNSYHVATLDHDAETIFDASITFVTDRTQGERRDVSPG